MSSIVNDKENDATTAHFICENWGRSIESQFLLPSNKDLHNKIG